MSVHCDVNRVLRVSKVSQITSVLGAPHWTGLDSFKIVKLNPKWQYNKAQVGPYSFNVGVRVIASGDSLIEQPWTIKDEALQLNENYHWM